MNDLLPKPEIKHRSLKGIKWLLLTNGLSLPLVYFTSVLLGRTSPEALGAYALVQIFISAITSFALLGGPQVLRTFLPKISGAEIRGRFLFSYGIIIGVFLAVILMVFRAYPDLLSLLLKEDVALPGYRGLVLLSFVVITAECLMGAAAGMMHIKLAAIARMMTRILILLVVGAYYLLDRSRLAGEAGSIIMTTLLLAYGLSTVISLIGLLRDPRLTFRMGWYLPKGFRSFAATSTSAVIFSFIYENFDRLLVLGLSGLKGLGEYQAVLTLAMLIDFFPKVLQNAVIPTFASLIASGDASAFKRAYGRVYRNSVLMITMMALTVMGLSQILLNMFGEAYGEYAGLLCLFAFVNIIRAPALATMAVLTSKEKNKLRLFMSVLQIAIQVVGSLCFIEQYGIIAIAGAKLVAVSIASTLGHLYVIYRMHLADGLPRSFIAGISSGCAVLGATLFLLPETAWARPLWALAGSGLFILFAHIRVDEIKELLLLFAGRAASERSAS